MDGWIKMHRLLLEKPIWTKSTASQKVILITLLLMANHKPNEWEWQGEKFEVKEGQFITSIEGIKQKAGKDITIQNIRSALNKFEKYDFLTNKSTKTGRLITIVNWHLYQCCDSEGNKGTNKEVTKTQQRPNKEVTPNKNEKNDKKKDIKDSPIPEKIFGEYKHVKLTESQYDKLQNDFGNADELIKHLDEWMEMNGKKYANCNLAIRKWVVNAVKKQSKVIEIVKEAPKEKPIPRNGDDELWERKFGIKTP